MASYKLGANWTMFKHITLYTLDKELEVELYSSMKITQILYVIWPIERVHKRLPLTEPVTFQISTG